MQLGSIHRFVVGHLFAQEPRTTRRRGVQAVHHLFQITREGAELIHRRIVLQGRSHLGHQLFRPPVLNEKQYTLVRLRCHDCLEILQH